MFLSSSLLCVNFSFGQIFEFLLNLLCAKEYIYISYTWHEDLLLWFSRLPSSSFGFFGETSLIVSPRLYFDWFAPGFFVLFRLFCLHTYASSPVAEHTHLIRSRSRKRSSNYKTLFIQVDYGRLDLLSLSESPHRDSAPFFLSRMRTSYRIMRHNWCCCCHGMPCDGCWLRLDGMLSFE